ncbi:MAG: tetratricopeptide repeat protein [Methylohalobius sp. ZOD2]
MRDHFFRCLPILTVLTAAFLAFWTYLPGLVGGFLFDDQPNLALNESLKHAKPTWDSLTAVAFSGDAGPLKRPVSMLSFGLNVIVAGMAPYWFKFTNVLIHLFNGALVYGLTVLLLGVLREVRGISVGPRRARWIAAAVSAVWLLHPLNLTSVTYTVQRMTSLAALFTFSGLILYVLGRRLWLRQPPRPRLGLALVLAGIGGLGALAALSKENGLLIVVFAFLIEGLFFRFQAATPMLRRTAVGLNLAWAAVPALGGAVYYLGLHLDQLASGYGSRTFTLTERVLTEPRILWWYVHFLLVPDIRDMGLFHDDIPLSHGLLDPPMTLFAILEWGLVAVVAIALHRRAPVFAFGVLFFLGGHAMESTIFPLEIVHEHRNYVPGYGVLLALFYYLLHPRFGRVLTRLRGAPVGGEPLLAARVLAVVGFAALAAGGTWARSAAWSDQRRLAMAEVTHHPESARANFTMGRVLIETAERYGRDSKQARELRELARTFYKQANRHDDYYLVGRFGLLTLDALDRKPVDSALVDELCAQMREGPVAANVIYTLSRLFQDEEKGRWKLPPGVLLRPTETLLSNSKLARKWRVELLVLGIQYAFRHQQYAAALRLARRQVALDPDDPAYRLNYAQGLFLTGDADGAARELEEAARLDPDDRMARARQFIEQAMLERIVQGVQARP